MISEWQNSIEELIAVLEKTKICTHNFNIAAELCCNAIKTSHKILVCGNGGSAADAQHFVAELVGWYENKVRGPIAAIALTTDTSCITAIANDRDYDSIFERQIRALGQPGDILIAISTSGRSRNILLALETAQSRQMRVIFLTGKQGEGLWDPTVTLAVPSVHTARIQEVHTLILHNLASVIEASIG